MDQIVAGLGTMISGSGTAQTAFNQIQGVTSDQEADLTALQSITTQLEAMRAKYQALTGN
jgi:hypothetical protein